MLEKCISYKIFIPKKQINIGIVYFIQEEDNFKRFKIGYTTNIASRLVDLQIGNPNLLVVYRKIENVSRKVEQQLHKVFEKYHLRGEWYNITPELI